MTTVADILAEQEIDRKLNRLLTTMRFLTLDVKISVEQSEKDLEVLKQKLEDMK